MITTIEELEALPIGSVVQTRNAGVLTKDSVGWWSCDNVVYGAEEVAQDALPATLLIPATISQEKFMEAWQEFVRAPRIRIGVEGIPAFAVALKLLGIEVSDV